MSRSDLPIERFGDESLISDFAELLTYERDAGFDRAMPDAVLVAPDAVAVRDLVDWCRRRGRPVVARGAGTGLSGGALASRGGIVVSLERLREIEVRAAARIARVGAGIPSEEVDAAARGYGLFYPPDPSSGRSSVIGGNVGTNAGGPHCFKYGVTSNYVRALEVVLADGRQVVLGGPVDSPGYDLRGLVVGSEGTLAIVTAATLDLRREPPAVRTLLISFERLSEAGEAVSALIAAGCQPAAIEAIDRRGMQVIEAYRQVGLPVEAGAALIVEVDGYPESLDRQSEEVSGLLSAHGGTVLRVARSAEERRDIWFARKSAAGALARLAPSYYLTDITVRRSRLA
ncbi:MAG: FAD-binding protein, partial [Thermoanaerobaculia bacterium]|nr:FAD-binding protein [Thermoanaerobaculia bacterium]